MDFDNYCKISINYKGTLDELFSLICSILNFDCSNVVLQIIDIPPHQIELRKNPDFNFLPPSDFPSGFLFFPFHLEIDPDAATPREDCIRFVSSLLENLWAAGVSAIAACDYEDQLPEKGGYKSRSIPWISEQF